MTFIVLTERTLRSSILSRAAALLPCCPAQVATDSSVWRRSTGRAAPTNGRTGRGSGGQGQPIGGVTVGPLGNHGSVPLHCWR